MASQEVTTKNGGIVNIGIGSFDIQERMLELSKKYYNIDDLNLLKSGFFGYTNEVMSDIFKNGVWHRNFLYNELFLNRAFLSSSIYNWGKLLDTPSLLAYPARMNVVMSISKNDIIANSIPVNGNPNIREFVINKANKFFAEGIPFLLQNSVRILLIRESSNNFSVTAQYLLNDIDDVLEELSSPYIKTYVENIDDKSYVMMALTIWQMELQQKTFSIYSNEIFDNIYFNTEFKDQLAYFEIYYKHNNETIPLPYYFNDVVKPKEEKHCFYALPDVDKFQLYFSSTPNSFRPAYNSEILLNLYTTVGSKGNFNFNLDVPITFKFQDDGIDIKSIMVSTLTNSYGGYDILTIEEFRQKLINKLYTRDSIISEKDLNLFFSSVVNSSTMNNSKIQFFKTRDDILRRSFSAYLLLNDKFNQLIPTNTIDLTGPNIEEFLGDTPNKVINSGELLIYDEESVSYRLINEEDDYLQFLEDDRFIYSLPFTLNIKTIPFPRVSYIFDICDQELNLKFDYVNTQVNNEFIIPHIEVSKLDFLSNYYKFNLIMGSNLDPMLISTDIIVRCVLSKGNTSYGYFDYKLNSESGKENEYVFSLKTSRKFDNNDEIEIISDVEGPEDINYLKRLNVRNIPGSNFDYDDYLENLGVSFYEKIPHINLPEGLEMKIYILIKDPPVNNKRKYSDNSSSSFDINLMKEQEDVSDYSIVSILSTKSDLNLFKSLSTLMYSDFTIKDVSRRFKIDKIPVIYTKYFNNVTNYTNFYKLFDDYVTILHQNLNLIEQNTKINVRFYNTYGPCKYSSIDRVNITFEINLKIKPYSYTSELDANIKNAVIKYMEEFNDKNRGLFTISGVYTRLLRDFPEIEYIEYMGINDFNARATELDRQPHLKQKIELVVPTPITHDPTSIDKEQLINFVPEYINIPKNKNYEISEENNNLVFHPNIVIKYIQNIIE